MKGRAFQIRLNDGRDVAIWLGPINDQNRVGRNNRDNRIDDILEWRT